MKYEITEDGARITHAKKPVVLFRERDGLWFPHEYLGPHAQAARETLEGRPWTSWKHAATELGNRIRRRK